MRTLPTALRDKIAAGDFTGENKATTRVTIQKIQLGLYTVGSEVYSSLPFLNTPTSARELPNVKSVSWNRSTDSNVASMNMEMWNTRPLPPGTGPDVGDQFDLLGFYTYNRGRTSYARQTWGHLENSWQEFLVPDRVVRVYQGYGADYSVVPELDQNLVLTGVWLIDDVTYSADGLITVECRDPGRLLVDQMMFPPVVPLPKYPLKFERYREVPNPPTKVVSAEWSRPTYEGSSNGKIGSSTEVQFGHHPADAFDGSADTLGSYWLSMGHDVPNHPSSFEWIQGAWNGDELQAAKIAVRGGRYRVYMSVWTDTARGGKITGWNGTALIPYTKAEPPIGTGTGLIERYAKIPYSVTFIVEKGAEFVVNFPPVKGITKIRFTFTNLYDSKHQPGPYRAAVRDIQVARKVVTETDNGTHIEGDYGDYSEIVKRLLAYGGFFWPTSGKQYLTNGNTVTYTPAANDPYLIEPDVATGNGGRVWGDIQMSGTNGPAALGVEIWDKKPLLDGINYVKDVLGFVFFVDEQGGAIFRSPNQFKLGNWLTDVNGLNGARSASFIELHDDKAILGLRAKLSSRNLREQVFVANVSGKFGAVAKGRIPHPSGLRRVGGWTDQHFETARECQIMADLITLRQLFTFRQDSLRIPANPAIQIDDQVKIYERTTGDAYFHYVRAISSTWELESGKWTYDLTTSWLGVDPAAEWAFNTSGMNQVTRDYLAALGQI